MPSGDLLDLARAAARAAQVDATDLAGEVVQAKAAVNDAYLACVGADEPWDFLEREGQWATVAGSDTYSLSSIATAIGITGATIREIASLVNDTDGHHLGRPLSWEQLEDHVASTRDDEPRAAPTMWAQWASRLRLFPIPDRVYTIGAFCHLTPARMSADGDLPLLPVAWARRLIVPYAAALLLEQEGGVEAAGQYDRLILRYEREHTQFRIAHASSRRRGFRTVAPGTASHLPGGPI